MNSWLHSFLKRSFWMLFSSTYAAHELPCFSMISPVSVWFCVLTYSAEIQKRQYYPFLVLNSWVILYEQSLIIALCVNKCSWILLPGLVEMWSWAVFADSCVFQFPAPSLQVYKYQKTFADASAKNKWLKGLYLQALSVSPVGAAWLSHGAELLIWRRLVSRSRALVSP